MTRIRSTKSIASLVIIFFRVYCLKKCVADNRRLLTSNLMIWVEYGDTRTFCVTVNVPPLSGFPLTSTDTWVGWEVPRTDTAAW